MKVVFREAPGTTELLDESWPLICALSRADDPRAGLYQIIHCFLEADVHRSGDNCRCDCCKNGRGALARLIDDTGRDAEGVEAGHHDTE